MEAGHLLYFTNIRVVNVTDSVCLVEFNDYSVLTGKKAIILIYYLRITACMKPFNLHEDHLGNLHWLSSSLWFVTEEYWKDECFAIWCYVTVYHFSCCDLLMALIIHSLFDLCILNWCYSLVFWKFSVDVSGNSYNVLGKQVLRK